MDENTNLETTEVAEEIDDLETALGENDAETADTQEDQEGTPETGSEETTEEEQPQQQIDVNAIAAAARRKSEERLQAIDAEYARRFGHLKNPKTGEPIRSQADYLAALDAQEEMKAKEQLKENGIDPAFLDNYIANNPVIRQAQAVMAQAQQQQTFNMINDDIAELSRLDPSITSLETIPNLPEINAIVQRSGGNIRLVDAYKIVNFGRVSESKQAAIKQSAINQAKGKQHLSPVNGVSTPDEGVEIPSDELSMWKDMFPDKSKAELKKLYNKTI